MIDATYINAHRAALGAEGEHKQAKHIFRSFSPFFRAYACACKVDYRYVHSTNQAVAAATLYPGVR